MSVSSPSLALSLHVLNVMAALPVGCTWYPVELSVLASKMVRFTVLVPLTTAKPAGVSPQFNVVKFIAAGLMYRIVTTPLVEFVPVKIHLYFCAVNMLKPRPVTVIVFTGVIATEVQ